MSPKEWIKFQRSWFVHNPPPREREVLLHPAKFPESLVGEFIQFFTKPGQVVLDPMVGTGSALIAAYETGRRGIGVELSLHYASIASRRISALGGRAQLPLPLEPEGPRLFAPLLLVADARDLDSLRLPPIDYCITSPPYWDMLHRPGFETQKGRREKGLDVVYSDSPRDLGNVHDYDAFVEAVCQVYLKVHGVLRPGAYLTVIVKNVKKGPRMYPLAWDIGTRLSQAYVLKDEKIWCQDSQRLAPYGMFNAWVSNTMHHYCLNFQKDKS